jgi:hypothetical protein
MDTLDSIPEQDEFRFEQIEQIRDKLEIEIVKRKKVYKKASQVLNGSEIMMFITSLTIASIGTASVIGNVITIPVSDICTTSILDPWACSRKGIG